VKCPGHLGRADGSAGPGPGDELVQSGDGRLALLVVKMGWLGLVGVFRCIAISGGSDAGSTGEIVCPRASRFAMTGMVDLVPRF
jgi:hypothetical protein